jgi:hypothetical protein
LAASASPRLTPGAKAAQFKTAPGAAGRPVVALPHGPEDGARPFFNTS